MWESDKSDTCLTFPLNWAIEPASFNYWGKLFHRQAPSITIKNIAKKFPKISSQGSNHFLTWTWTRVAQPLFCCCSWTPPSAILRPWLRAAPVSTFYPRSTGFATNCPCLPARPFSMHCSREKIRLISQSDDVISRMNTPTPRHIKVMF